MNKSDKKNNYKYIYLNIDYLKKGNYIFNFLIKEKIYKFIKIKKNKDL